MEEQVRNVTKAAKVNDKQPSCNLLHLQHGKTIRALARKRSLQQCSKAEANEDPKKQKKNKEKSKSKRQQQRKQEA